jgi:hypothetical protein
VTSVRAVSTNRYGVGVRARASGRDLHGLDTRAGQDRVEGPGELPGPVADQEPEVRGAITEVHQEIADLLCGPRTVWVSGDGEDVHVAAAGFDDEQAVQALEGHCAADVKEAGGEHRRCLGAQELPPGRVGVPEGSQGDLQGLENPADRGGAHPVTELEQFALGFVPQRWFPVVGRSISAAFSALTGGRPVRCG